MNKETDRQIDRPLTKDALNGCFFCENAIPTFSYSETGKQTIDCALNGFVLERLDCPDRTQAKVAKDG